MKNKISIIIGFMFSIMVCYGQSDNQLNDLLNKSIEKHMVNKNLEQVVFLKDNIPLDFQFSKTIIDSYGVTFFDRSNYRKSELKEGIRCFRLLPVVLNDNALLITIADIFVSRKGNNTIVGSGDYIIYEYKYSCEKKQWELFDIKAKGI